MPIQPRPEELPCLWLLSDARNDAVLAEALVTMPARSGFVFRHYHLQPAERRERWEMLRSIVRSKNHLMVLSGDADTGVEWGADGIYGPPGKLGRRPGLLRLATAHDGREIHLANRNGADALFLSPVFPTRSHPGGGALGATLFHDLAARSTIPVIALGGMTAERARELGVRRWAAIDGLS
ncbi:thiamine phosphate synthase [Citromicrobium bathyomarinum]|uniref:thiamine phosphate synthase n=1 Tax=Citromicrobium bathyomarinum TaxID=72174 RepID=UPI00315A2EAE